MKNALTTLRTLSILFVLAITSVNAFAQGKNNSATILPGFQPSENWVSASKACLGYDAGLTLVGDMMDERSSELFTDEQTSAMVIFTELSADERYELLNAPEVSPFASSRMVYQSSQRVEGGMQYTYAVNSKVLMTLVVPTQSDDNRIAVILAGSKNQMEEVAALATTCIATKGGNDQLMAKN